MNRSTDFRNAQRGAVLIISLIMLVILTLLGVTGMTTSSLEEKMAANSQEYGRAFQAAETALSQGFNNSEAWIKAFADPYDTPGGWQVLPMADATDGAGYTARFLNWTNPPLGSLYSSTTFQAAHFNFRSTGGTTTSADRTKPVVDVTINGGAYQIAPKQQ